MRKLSVALLLYFGLACAALAEPVGPVNDILCNKIGNLPVGNTTITQIIAGVASQSINICGWHVTNTGATGTYSISYGTGTNCATGTTTVVPTTNVTSTAPDVDHIDYAMVTIPAGNALCITSSVATVSTLIFYSQF